MPESSQFPFLQHTYTPHTSTRYYNVAKSGKKKALPELYEKREECCGCTACFAICPVKAIAMLRDEEGFLYPVVDANKCIRCYRCLDVCIFKENQIKQILK